MKELEFDHNDYTKGFNDAWKQCEKGINSFESYIQGIKEAQIQFEKNQLKNRNSDKTRGKEFGEY